MTAPHVTIKKKRERRKNIVRTNGLYVPVIAILVIIVVILWDSNPADFFVPQDELPPPTFDQYPYAVIEQANTRHFTKDGSLSYTLNAELLQHFRRDMTKPSPDDYMLLDQLEITLFSEGEPWLLSAEKGRLSENGGVLSLWQNVKIWQNDTIDRQTLLTTTHITVKPKEKMIMTDADITITNPKGVINATGMVVNIQQQRINLLSSVRAEHEPI